MTFKEFQDFYCNKFQRNNPLPWQDGMQAIIWYVTEGLPANTRAYVTITNNPTGVTVTGEGVDGNPYVWTFNFNKEEVKGSLEDYNYLSVEPTNKQGSVVVTQLDGEYKIEFDATIKAERQDGTFANVPTTVTLPIKAGEGITIDATEDGTFAEIKGGGGAKYMHVITLGGMVWPVQSQLRIVSSKATAYTSWTELAKDMESGVAETYGHITALGGAAIAIAYYINSGGNYSLNGKEIYGTLGVTNIPNEDFVIDEVNPS